MVRWYVEVPDLVGFVYVNMITFPLVIHEYLYLLLCGFYGCSIVVIMWRLWFFYHCYYVGYSCKHGFMTNFTYGS